VAKAMAGGAVWQNGFVFHRGLLVAERIPFIYGQNEK
jgi:hypothetical protein